MKKLAIGILVCLAGIVSTISATALSDLTASLAPGQSSTELGCTWTGGGQPTGDDLNWINKFHYDPVRQVAFINTKRQNCNTCMEHGWYDEKTNQWVSENCGFNAPGHAWDAVGYDHAQGVGYVIPGGSRDDVLYASTWTPGQPLSRPTIATSTASGQINTILYSGNYTFASGSAAMDWHPNLFGSGEPGMVIVCQKGIGGWRKSSNTWHIIVPSGNYSIPPNSPGCVYSRGLGAVIASVNKDGRKLFKIDDYNSWISSNDPGLDAAPIDFGFDHGGASIAAIVDDPLERPTMYALEKNGSNRVWKYNNGKWTVQSFKHPFVGRDNYGENWMVAAMYGHGCIWALEGGGSGLPRSRIWRPDDIAAAISNAPVAVEQAHVLRVSPNPFYVETKIAVSYQLSAVSRIDMALYNINGKLVKKLRADSRELKAGITLNTTSLPNGIYVLKTNISGKIYTKQLFLMK
jgi:hypothetical protein